MTDEIRMRAHSRAIREFLDELVQELRAGKKPTVPVWTDRINKHDPRVAPQEALESGD
jgi:hypothetical protein